MLSEDPREFLGKALAVCDNGDHVIPRSIMGYGLMFTTFRATWQSSGKPCVVKIFADARFDTPENRKRLERLVAENLNGLRPLDVFAPTHLLRDAAGHVAPMASGVTLGQYLEKRPTRSPHAWVTLGLALVALLDVLRQRGVSHGDLHPANILVCETAPGVWEVRLIDLDNCVLAGQAPPPLAGAASFLAPEVLEGAPVTPESDRYALTVLIHWLLLLVTPAQNHVPANDKATLFAFVKRRQWLDHPKHGRPKNGLSAAVYGEHITELFRRGIEEDPERRPRLPEWKDALLCATLHMLECPHCHCEQVAGAMNICAFCDCVLSKPALELANGKTIRLRRLETPILLNATDTPSAIIHAFGPSLTLKASKPGLELLNAAGQWVPVPIGVSLPLVIGTRLRLEGHEMTIIDKLQGS